MAAFKHLANLVKSEEPAAFERLKAAHPHASELLGLSRTMGVERPLTPADLAGAAAFCKAGLDSVQARAERLVRTLDGRLRRARWLKLSGAIIAMGSSAGLAASALDIISLGPQATDLTLSGLAFAGALAAALSEDMNRGGARGADASTLLDKLAKLSGRIERGRLKYEAAIAAGGQGDAFVPALRELEDAAYEFGEIRTMFRGA